MRKIFVYTEEQEKEIDRRMGYTQEELDRMSPIKQWQWPLGMEEFRDHMRRRKQKVCPFCGAKLEWVRVCKYVGLCLPLGVSRGSKERSYEVKDKRYCPNCDRIIE